MRVVTGRDPFQEPPTGYERNVPQHWTEKDTLSGMVGNVIRRIAWLESEGRVSRPDASRVRGHLEHAMADVQEAKIR